GDEGEVVEAALSPDGTQIALCFRDRPVSVWDTFTGECLADFPECNHLNEPIVAFSPDGAKLVTGSCGEFDISLRIWEVSTGAQVGNSGNSLQRHSEMVSGVAFSPDGSKMILGSEDGTIKIWDATQVVADLDPDRNALHSVAFNLDGTKVLAVDCTGNLQIYDSISGDPLAGSEKDNERKVKSVAFSADRTKIGAVFNDGRVRVWDDITANPWHSVEMENAPINLIAFSPNGSRIALNNWRKETVSIWAWDATLGCLIRGPCLDGAFNIVKFSPNGTQIVTSNFNEMKIWDVHTGQLVHTLAGHTSNVSLIAFSPDGTRIVSLSENQTVRIWDAATGVQLGQPLQGFEGRVISVDCSSDGSKIVSGYKDSTLRIWDITTG
ncbi:hypothetical protein GYMLUDRAFT_127461, partial [Collybiopsis luxurians FD-317 M1]